MIKIHGMITERLSNYDHFQCDVVFTDELIYLHRMAMFDTHTLPTKNTVYDKNTIYNKQTSVAFMIIFTRLDGVDDTIRYPFTNIFYQYSTESAQIIFCRLGQYSTFESGHNQRRVWTGIPDYIGILPSESSMIDQAYFRAT